MDNFIQQLINGLNIGAIYALIALGYTMVYGILRLINFAHGDVYMVGAFAGFFIALKLGVAGISWGGPVIAVLGAMVVLMLILLALRRFNAASEGKRSLLLMLLAGLGAAAGAFAGYKELFGAFFEGTIGNILWIVFGLVIIALIAVAIRSSGTARNYSPALIIALGILIGLFAGYFMGRLGVLAGPAWGSLVIVLGGSMIVAALVGMTIERFAYRPVRKYSRMTTLITAIGVSLLIENLFVARIGSAQQAFPELVTGNAYHLFGRAQISKPQLVIFAVSIALMLLLQWIIYRTKIGTAMRAVSFNLNSAKLMGINTNVVISFTFALGSALAAAGGVLTAQYNPSIDPLMGIIFGLKAFVAAVLGGIGNIPGAVLGGLVIGVAETMVVAYGSNIGIESSYRDAVAFAILILVLLLRPAGLLGSTVQEKV